MKAERQSEARQARPDQEPAAQDNMQGREVEDHELGERAKGGSKDMKAEGREERNDN